MAVLPPSTPPIIPFSKVRTHSFRILVKTVTFQELKVRHAFQASYNVQIDMSAQEDYPMQRASLAELASYFTRLGFTAFGGPAAHIALMHDDLVVRKRWISGQQFTDLLGAVQLVPGPNSTEMAIHIGYTHQRYKGMLVSGAGFILPAFFIVLALSIFYVAYGGLPQVSALLYGIQPVVVAIVVQAVYKLGLTACRKPAMLALAVAALLVTVSISLNTILVILGGGLIGVLLYSSRRGLGISALSLLSLPLDLWRQAAESISPTLARLFWFFLTVGATAMGSGYVLVSYLADQLVNRYGWLTQQQLIDAIVVGQMTPGPVFTTAAFAGYVIMAGPTNNVLSGVAGATVSALGIFLPSFFIVWLLGDRIARLRQSRPLGAFLDGVNAAVVGSIAATSWSLFQTATLNLPAPVLPVGVADGAVDLAAVALFGVSLALLIALPRLNATWLILGGALAGWLMVSFI
jgi:chromate transporter